jgi:hypothetical protein
VNNFLKKCLREIPSRAYKHVRLKDFIFRAALGLRRLGMERMTMHSDIFVLLDRLMRFSSSRGVPTLPYRLPLRHSAGLSNVAVETLKFVERN